MTLCLHTPNHTGSAERTLLERVRKAAHFKGALVCLLLLMFAGNCQALMQGQGVFEPSTISVDEFSSLADDHDCCPEDKADQNCESCLDDRAVKPRSLEVSAELEGQLLLFSLILPEIFTFSSPLVSHVFYEQPPFSSYPAIYVTQLHFLE